MCQRVGEQWKFVSNRNFSKIPFCEYKFAETISETMFKCKSNIIHVFKTLLVVSYSECSKIPLSCCWSASMVNIKIIKQLEFISSSLKKPIMTIFNQQISMKQLSLTLLQLKHTFETLCFNFVAKTLKAKCSMNLLTEWKINI